MSNITLEVIIDNFFKDINKYIIIHLKNDTIKNEYEHLAKYCMENPTFIFRAIDCIYPVIDNKNIDYINAFKVPASILTWAKVTRCGMGQFGNTAMSSFCLPEAAPSIRQSY